MASSSNEIRKLTTLLQISQALSGTVRLKAALHGVLETVAAQHSAERGLVVVEGDAGGELNLEATYGLPRPPHQPRYVKGEGVVGRVVASGRPVVVPRVSREPDALADPVLRAAAPAGEQSFVCVPIAVDRRPVGALGVIAAYKPDRDFERAAKFYGVVGSMIGQAIKLQRLIAADRQRLVDENTHLRQELRERYDFSALVGTSAPMRHVYQQLEQVARTNTTVLIRGESGTGKELVAQAIHYNSLRAERPFVKVSCGALPDALIESELFGYEKGAFTGAAERKKGRFELAEGGTLFLDEVGEIASTTQVKLLRVLQEREFERLGGTQTVRSNVRLIAATNAPLEGAIAQGTFRADLFYRLNVFTIFVPPLRERKPDILLLAEHFLERFAAEHGRQIKRIATPAIDMLTAYHWPGNARELQNVIERAVLVSEAQVIHAHHLPPTLQTAEATGTHMSHSLREAVDAYEKDLIQDALKSARGNRARAARLLRTTERVFNYKVRKLRIPWERFRA